MELTKDNKELLKKFIYLLTPREINFVIKVNENDKKYKESLLLINLPTVIINIICEYTNNVFELCMKCYVVNYKLPFDQLDFVVNIIIQNAHIRLDCQYTNNLKCNVSFTSASESILKCFNSHDSSDEILHNKINKGQYDNDLLRFFDIQYFFNTYMKQQYGYDNYMNIEINPHNRCEYTNNGYLHSKTEIMYCRDDLIYEEVWTTHYYLLRSINHDIMTNIIMICNTIINELKAIMAELYSGNSLYKLCDFNKTWNEW